MARIDQYSRILHHRLTAPGAQFTIPSSSDHTDETWAATDLYIGELGINVTDDKIFMRTNNGIVQLATATASAGGTNIWVYSGTQVQIGGSYSLTTSIVKTPGSTGSVDLGTTSDRFSGVYLGGNADLKGVINTSNSLDIRNSAGKRYLTADYMVSSEDSAIHIGTYSQTVDKLQGIFINSSNSEMRNGSRNRTIISSNNVIMDEVAYAAALAAQNVQIGDSTLGTKSNIIHIGPGYSKKNTTSNTVTVGGAFGVRNLDNGTNGGNSQPIYAESDWITAQARLDTVDALSNAIVSLPWTSGDAIQMKAYVMGVNRDDGTVYSSEISASGINLGSGFVKLTGDPYILEQSTFGSTFSIAPNDIAESTIECDLNYFYIKVKGHSASEVNWIVTYSYHRMKNLFS